MKLLPLLLLAALPGSLPAQPTPGAPPIDSARARKIAAAFPVLDKIYADYAARNHVPGLAYALVVDGRLVHAGALGYADARARTAATPQSVFRIASMTKSFVALAVLRLRDEGRLRLDAPAETYLPELKKYRPNTLDAPPVTVRQLLSHAAGLPEDNPWGDRQMGRSDAALAALLGRGLSMANAPGVAYEYSNLGYALLGRLVSRVAGQPFQAYISARILRPLGMNDTYWDYRRVPAGRLAHGYRWQAGAWQPEPLLPNGGAFAALGGLLTTVEDFAKYLAFQASAWPPRPGPDAGPVRRSSVREMQQPWTFNALNAAYRYPSGRASPMVNSYGFGLRVARDGAGRGYVGHGGGLPGFGSHWWLLPDYGVAVVALDNLTYAGPTAANFAALDTLVALAGLRPRAPAGSAILAQRQAELARLLPAWEVPANSPLFAENFFLDEPLAGRRQAAQALFARAGKIGSVGPLVPENQLRGRFLLTGEQAAIEVFFSLTPETPARVQQLDLRLLPR
ncbi:serine hydrolase domain-containing protein [Hymenobacter caeli]|uniref:CubicO group peptidase (Beta-lactamase class C family) n=1 Tax=Hymenobacter caeli TaxID=2735894 RepID=A0ABX2FUD2_9BACT|nr:serine hydrolase domain-containing protein [Hymenobacter caeli]NRT20015.1 CubicO group peptidase (beta-lactamase class C family) [Hymenobacter caeli]